MSSLQEVQKGNNSKKVLQCQLDFSVRDSNHPEIIFPLAFNLSPFSRKFWYVHMVCWVDWKLIWKTIIFLSIWKWIDSFLAENENFFKLYLVVYSTPGSPRNTHLWQTAVTRLPSCISAKRRPTIRRIFLHLEYLALTNAASRSVAERKAGECLTSTSCCIQSTPPSLWTGQYSLVFVLEMPQCHST